MKSNNVYSYEQLHAFLLKVFENTYMPRPHIVLFRLMSVCGLTEKEALQVQNEAIKVGLLCPFDQRKENVFSFHYSYNGMSMDTDTDTDTTDITDTGVSRTAHNAPEPPKGMKKQSRYGKGSKETVLNHRKRAKVK